VVDPIPFEQQQRWVAKAARAPSAHNTQPARWKFADDGSIYLFEDRRRQLHVADAHGTDQMIALGTAFEGMCLAACEDGLRLGQADFDIESAGDESIRAVARTRVQGPGPADELAHLVGKRATYRGRFLDNDVDSSIFDSFRARSDMVVISKPDEIRAVADVHDSCTCKLTSNDHYYAELYEWLRFNSSHAAWARDGLSATALSMSAVERLFGPWFAHPAAFRIWVRLGLAKFLVSEKPAVCSASALLIFVQPTQTNRFEAGRAFYRLWLTITGLGLALCPMSALMDHPDGKRYIEQHWPAIKEREMINVFRVGAAPPGLPRPAARLPVDELILT
jgi:nitroreductase